MPLITDAKDERLLPAAYDNGYEGMRMAIIDMGVLRASLIAAFSRAEAQECFMPRGARYVYERKREEIDLVRW